MAEQGGSKTKAETVLRLQTVSDPIFSKPVREYIARIAEVHGFSKEGAFELRLIVGEAIANIYRHAYSGRKDRPIFIEIYLYPTYIELRIRDLGIQKPASEIVSRDLSEYRESGLGIFLISKLSDYHFYDQSETKGTQLVVKKRIC